MSIRENIIDIPVEHISNVFGSCDSYVKKIEKTLKVTIVMRDGELKIIGGEGAVERALIVFNKLIELSRRGNVITEQNVDYAIALSMEGNADAITEIDKDVVFKFAEGYKDFLNVCKTERESIKEAVRLLEDCGFKEFEAFDTLKEGDKVYKINKNKDRRFRRSFLFAISSI